MVDDAFSKKKISNLLIEFGCEPHIVLTYRGQNPICIYHSRGKADEVLLTDLAHDKFSEWFIPDETEEDASQDEWVDSD